LLQKSEQVHLLPVSEFVQHPLIQEQLLPAFEANTEFLALLDGKD